MKLIPLDAVDRHVMPIVSLQVLRIVGLGALVNLSCKEDGAGSESATIKLDLGGRLWAQVLRSRAQVLRSRVVIARTFFSADDEEMF